MRSSLGRSRIGIVGLAATVMLVACSAASSDDTGAQASSSIPTTSQATTTSRPSTTSTVPVTTTTAPRPPAPDPRYVLLDAEVAPEAKELAIDIALALTTYEDYDDPLLRYLAVGGLDGFAGLAEAAAPLTHPGLWSRGSVVYPQLGGLTDTKVSVMTVTRQTVGSGAEPLFTLVRTLDIRLVQLDGEWVLDHLASAGGVFASLEDLALAHAVAADPRIEMPDSARLDILEGIISPVLLELMLEMADITPYGITVMATGHPYHVFETNRVSHHTGGRAIDINRVGDRHVIEDREPGSPTSQLVDWLWKHPRVIQVGSPSDVDGGGTNRSFENTVHQDHIHVAVIGPTDPTWVPAIGNRVWEDLDGDGIQDEGEPGVAGVTVTLYDGAGGRLGTTQTTSTGAYEFRNLYYGEYRVEIGIPSGYRATWRDRGSDDGIDSDIDSNGRMAQTLLDPREHDPTWDAGIYRPASIGDLVWHDVDADGIRDAGEPGMSGVTVRLLDASGSQVASTTTGSDGSYLFSGLAPGTYSISVAIPSGYVATPRDRGSDDAADSDIDGSGTTAATLLTSNETDRTWDAGLTLPASVGDFVWVDLDPDGIQDPGESGLAGVTVRLFTASGVEIRTDVTDVDGAYEFVGLVPGTYRIEIDIPDGYAPTLQDQADGIPATEDDEIDSDIDALGETENFVLAPNQNDVDLDAGFVVVVP